MNAPCFLLFICLIFSVKGTWAQKAVPDRRAKAVYIEFLGNNMGGGPSLNFDMHLKRKTNRGFGAKIGFGANEAKRGQYYRNYVVPAGIYYTQGTERIMLESGLGVSFLRTDKPYQIDKYTGVRGNFIEISYSAGYFANLGLRIQPKRTGMLLRIFWAPLIVLEEPYFHGSFGLSVGFGFK